MFAVGLALRLVGPMFVYVYTEGLHNRFVVVLRFNLCDSFSIKWVTISINICSNVRFYIVSSVNVYFRQLHCAVCYGGVVVVTLPVRCAASLWHTCRMFCLGRSVPNCLLMLLEWCRTLELLEFIYSPGRCMRTWKFMQL